MRNGRPPGRGMHAGEHYSNRTDSLADVRGAAATGGVPRAAPMQSSTATAYSHRAIKLIP
jgi:hypothetical protein